MDVTENNYHESIARLSQGLKLAREARGKSIKECSSLIGISTSRLRSYENGKFIPSLPEIESLSYFYNIPLSAIYDPDLLPQYINNPNASQLNHLLKIRAQFIATQLQISREISGKSYKEISKETSISTSRLKRYEKGESNIPLDDLFKIAAAIDLDINNVVDKESPIGIWQENHKRLDNFSKLSKEIQSFTITTENQPFIAFTRKIKAIGVDNLMKLSDSIQQIVDSSNSEE